MLLSMHTHGAVGEDNLTVEQPRRRGGRAFNAGIGRLERYAHGWKSRRVERNHFRIEEKIEFGFKLLRLLFLF